ncbi:hypothetical protein ABVK25_004643 [Lepraria finkii]|uniref:Uncharacterized protein n=1 Tax=Lepraria finkii TaxID=1340010 RepID=A0ABR4BCC3_9LECA
MLTLLRASILPTLSGSKNARPQLPLLAPPASSSPTATPTKPVNGFASVAAATGSSSSSVAPPAATTGSADLKLVAFPKANCQDDAMPVTVYYGAQVQAQAVSYSLSRDLTSSEQLDFS